MYIARIPTSIWLSRYWGIGGYIDTIQFVVFQHPRLLCDHTSVSTTTIIPIRHYGTTTTIEIEYMEQHRMVDCYNDHGYNFITHPTGFGIGRDATHVHIIDARTPQ